MARYYILSKTVDDRYARVYEHLPVPSTKNVAGQALNDDTLTYQRAYKEKKLQEDGEITSQVPGLSAAELTQLQNGEIAEYFVEFRFDNPDLTNAQRKTQIENGNANGIEDYRLRGFAQHKLDIVDPTSELYKELIEPLAWWGYYADI
jgi:hypothetical protein